MKGIIGLEIHCVFCVVFHSNFAAVTAPASGSLHAANRDRSRRALTLPTHRQPATRCACDAMRGKANQQS